MSWLSGAVRSVVNRVKSPVKKVVGVAFPVNALLTKDKTVRKYAKGSLAIGAVGGAVIAGGFGASVAAAGKSAVGAAIVSGVTKQSAPVSAARTTHPQNETYTPPPSQDVFTSMYSPAPENAAMPLVARSPNVQQGGGGGFAMLVDTLWRLLA